ncbi:hypothetical protein [Brachybacterium kimchii]|uniref:HIRAN domain-containing protein n=1 Tax=Brachybacterium kimchii TaxID=2942909 RepID=A0ABY4N2A8_9MICO|nr:hypothetical protein [Brachybacterium kimchii]UQN28269.1 hypothetical protein M4486_11475 [Brachybacterium kimchii]
MDTPTPGPDQDPTAGLPSEILLRMRQEARTKVLEARKNAHVRTDEESTHPSGRIDVVTCDEARPYDLESTEPLEQRPCYWTGIRGAQFADPTPWHYQPEIWHDVTGELVPEPENPADQHAVAIDLDGTRVGYMSANSAEHAHRLVSTLRARGSRVHVPLRIRIRHNRLLEWPQIEGYAALPTFVQFDQHLPTEEQTRDALQPLWDALAPGVIEQIARDNFYLTTSTLHEFIELRHLAPSVGLPDRALLQAVPRGVELFLSEQGVAHRRARTQERERLMQERNARIIAQHRAGAPVAEIADEEQLSTGRVRMILREMTLQSHLNVGGKQEDAASKADLVSYIARCRDARMRRRAGVPRERIAKDMELDSASLKTHLADGKFIENPRANTNRLTAARTIRAQGVTPAECRNNSELRALRDTLLLDLVLPGWQSDAGREDQAE